MRLTIIRLTLLLLACTSIHAETFTYRIGKGTLQESNQGTILRLQGKPYEIGVQHGRLLKEKIHENLKNFIEIDNFAENPRVKAFKSNLSKIIPFIPADLYEEMQGLAQGADASFEKILLMNLFPEMFHCMGITAQDEATADHSLYHVRVLDYRIGKGLQKSAILMLIKPEDKESFVSVSYAGFVGCITGMNEQKIAIGEIGGLGYGHYEGIPMSFLMREVLENASTLDEAKELFTDASRTCEYYYMISDGNEEKAVSIYATPDQIKFIEPGNSYAIMAPDDLPKGQDNKYVSSPISTLSSEFQIRVNDKDGKPIALFNHQPEHCMILRGMSHSERYPLVAKRIQDAYGKIDAETLQEIIKAPATDATNLHNAIFHPSTLNFWVSHAGYDGSPASEQHYEAFNLQDLLED